MIVDIIEWSWLKSRDHFFALDNYKTVEKNAPNRIFAPKGVLKNEMWYRKTIYVNCIIILSLSHVSHAVHGFFFLSRKYSKTPRIWEENMLLLRLVSKGN